MDEQIELTYQGLKKMKKNDFTRLFKKAAPWKKATAVLFLAKYKFSNGKVDLVAIPYKKYNEAAMCYKKEVKKDSTYTAKLTSLASLEQTKDPKGNVTFKVTPTQGSMNVDFLQNYGAELFGKLKVGIEVVGTDGKMDKDDLLEVVEAAEETLSNKKSEKIIAKQAKRLAKAQKIQEKVGQFEKAIGKVDTPKLTASLEILYKAIEDLTEEAMEDGKISEEEQKSLDKIQKQIEESEMLVQDVDRAKNIVSSIEDLLNQF